MNQNADRNGRYEIKAFDPVDTCHDENWPKFNDERRL
jgi:hypothetical protein